MEAAALDGKRRLFVNVENQNQIAVVSLATGAVVQRYLLSGCQAPTGLGYSKEHALLVSACTNGVIKVLDDEGIERANLSVGPHPDAVIEDASRDRMFIPSGGDGSLSEIILSPTPHINRIWATKLGARTGAFDPRRQRIYLPYGDTIRLKGQKAKLVPGSFGILVIDVH